MLGPAARHGGLERGLAGDTAVLGRRPLGSLLNSVPPAPQGPARRARLLTCADVRGPGQGGGGRDRASIGHHGDWSSVDVGGGRKGGSGGGRGLNGAFLPGSGSLRSSRRLAAARGGIVPWPSQFLGLLAEGQERALAGGAEGCSDLDLACRLLYPRRRSMPTPGTSRQNLLTYDHSAS